MILDEGGSIRMEKQYIRSERAHFMCPNMHFGILVSIKEKLDIHKIKDSLDIMSKAHPFLRSIIKYESGSTNMYYDIENRSTIEIHERESIETIWRDYREIGSKEWNVLENGLLKVFVYPMDEEMKVLFVAHHLLGDGRCLLELVNEFANLYAQGIEPVCVQERLIQGIEDLPAKSNLAGVSKYLVKYLNKQWEKEQVLVTYKEYEKFSDEFVKSNPVSHEVTVIEKQEFISMKSYCKEHGITINDLLMAKMYTSMNTEKIIIAADIRNKLKCYYKGAYGNYATAMGVVCKHKNKDILNKAIQVHKQVKRQLNNNQKLMLVLSCYLNMNQDLIDAVAIATLGNFESKAARFVGGNMFGYQKRNGISITNLGSLQNENILDAIFIPPASPATIQTIGALTVNNKMHLCSSYYERAITSEKVKMQLEALR